MARNCAKFRWIDRAKQREFFGQHTAGAEIRRALPPRLAPPVRDGGIDDSTGPV